MYKIGTFANMTSLSVKTLRYYDEIGVLKPQEIDPFTGYRSYSEEQVNEANYIKMLKELDFSLEEIKNYKDIMDYNILDAKKDEITYKIEEYVKKIDRIEELQRTSFRNNKPNVRTKYKIAC